MKLKLFHLVMQYGIEGEKNSPKEERKGIGLPLIRQTEFRGRVVVDEAVIEKIPAATVL
jgi:hypothetical protein